ncbi:hypothetical protein N9104_01680 [Pseudomonadales bacterium]|nr:hypothetical protein [Pseudomonadales bacterium]
MSDRKHIPIGIMAEGQDIFEGDTIQRKNRWNDAGRVYDEYVGVVEYDPDFACYILNMRGFDCDMNFDRICNLETDWCKWKIIRRNNE